VYLADLQKTYENLMTNLGKILRSFKNRAPVFMVIGQRVCTKVWELQWRRCTFRWCGVEAHLFEKHVVTV